MNIVAVDVFDTEVIFFNSNDELDFITIANRTNEICHTFFFHTLMKPEMHERQKVKAILNKIAVNF